MFDFITDGMRATDYIIPWIEFETSLITRKNNEYGAVKIGNFDSVSEYVRYQILLQRQEKGEISNLKTQVEFKTNDRNYIADFTYMEKGKLIVEDVKSPRLLYSKRFREAQAIMKKVYGVEIRIISPKYLSK